MPATPPPAPPRPPPLLRRRAPPPCASASRNNRPGRRDRRHAPERPKIIAPVAALASTRQPRVRAGTSRTHRASRASATWFSDAAPPPQARPPARGEALRRQGRGPRLLRGRRRAPRRARQRQEGRDSAQARGPPPEERALARGGAGPGGPRRGRRRAPGRAGQRRRLLAGGGDARPGRPLRARAALPLRQEAVLALPRLRRGLRAGPPRAPHAPASFLPRRRRDRGSTAPPTHRVRAQARASPTAAVLWARSRRSPRTRRPS